MRLGMWVSVSALLWTGARTLSDELPLELVEELECELVLCGQRLLTNDSLHRCRVTPNSVFSILNVDQNHCSREQVSSKHAAHTHQLV